MLLDRSYLIDRRRKRAQALQAAILQIVGKHLSDEDYRRNAMRALSYELFDKLYQEGVEIITDADRAEAGLPPRGPEGWTMEELLVLEERRLESMRCPVIVTVER